MELLETSETCMKSGKAKLGNTKTTKTKQNQMELMKMQENLSESICVPQVRSCPPREWSVQKWEWYSWIMLNT